VRFGRFILQEKDLIPDQEREVAKGLSARRVAFGVSHDRSELEQSAVALTRDLLPMKWFLSSLAFIIKGCFPLYLREPRFWSVSATQPLCNQVSRPDVNVARRCR
jgi:hypothetical protein